MISDMPSFRSSVSQGWRCDEPEEMLTESATLKKNVENLVAHPVGLPLTEQEQPHKHSATTGQARYHFARSVKEES